MAWMWYFSESGKTSALLSQACSMSCAVLTTWFLCSIMYSRIAYSFFVSGSLKAPYDALLAAMFIVRPRQLMVLAVCM